MKSPWKRSPRSRSGYGGMRPPSMLALSSRDKSPSTMRGWCEEHGLGRRVGGGTWMASKVALAMFLVDGLMGFRPYHAGKLAGPPGISFFLRERLGEFVVY